MDFRLIATDMDGTLLDEQKRIPESFWPLLDELRAAGAAFAPASGRQFATLRTQFERAGEPMSFIAENGTVVVHNGEIISTTAIDPDTVHAIIDAARNPEAKMAAFVCRPERAFVEHPDKEFLAEGAQYYYSLSDFEDLHEAVNEEVIKVAIFSSDDAETVIAPLIRAAAPDAHVVVSGRHWVDVMDPSANKGTALAALREAMGIDRSQTLVFGDYLNDTELIEEAGTSYAMSNAHPDILALADRTAPSNVEEGVVTVLRELLDAHHARHRA